MRTAAVIIVLCTGGCAVDARTNGSPKLEQFTETIAGTAVSFDMLPVPGDADAGIASFWIARTEVTWDVFDVFLHGLDSDAGAHTDADAVTRPSKPYISMDRGFGHAGYPAISMSYRSAAAFCEWLTLKTGRRYRLPSSRQWRHACVLGRVDPAVIGDVAWYRGNADHRTHPVASKAPDALGVHDLYGNASEWCTGDDGHPITLGGCYRDDAEDVGCAARVVPTEAWNQSDPQIPRSVWWLADAGFVGFRVVCTGPGQEREQDP